MMRKVVVVVVVLALSCALALANRRVYRGPNVTFDFTQAPLGDLARLLGDVGGVNIVVLGVENTKVDIKAKDQRWDKVLADMLAGLKLAHHRVGNVYLVGEPEVIAAHKKKQAKRYKGARITIDIRSVDPQAAATLVAVTVGKPIEVERGLRFVRMRLKAMPYDQAADLLALQSGGTLAAKPVGLPAAREGCAAAVDDLPIAGSRHALELEGIAMAGTKRRALFVDGGGGVHVVAEKDCIGKERAVVKRIGQGEVTLIVGKDERLIHLYPPGPQPVTPSP